MIPSAHTTRVRTNTAAVGQYGIDADSTEHIMRILRDSLYSDKIGAVIREYCANARDANLEAGHEGPIEVHVPTVGEPWFSVRDHGKGLSQEDVGQVYCQYGKSTKRNSNTQIGMLGIGCKSGFAYGDYFEITSCHNGRQTQYVAALSDQGGTIQKVGETPTTDTGITIRIDVRKEDIESFQRSCVYWLAYMPTKANWDIPYHTPELEGIATISQKSGGTALAIMGGIPYRIDLSALSRHASYQHISKFFTGQIHLWFEIGELDVSASREALEYRTPTINRIVDRIEQVIDLLLQRLLRERAACKNQYERKLWDCRVADSYRKWLPGFEALLESQSKQSTVLSAKRPLVSEMDKDDPEWNTFIALAVTGGTPKWDNRLDYQARPPALLIVRDDHPRAVCRYDWEQLPADVLAQVKEAKKLGAHPIPVVLENRKMDPMQAAQLFIQQNGIEGIPVVRSSALRNMPRGQSSAPNPLAKHKVLEYMGGDNWKETSLSGEDFLWVRVLRYKPLFKRHPYLKDVNLKHIIHAIEVVTGEKAPTLIGIKAGEDGEPKTTPIGMDLEDFIDAAVHKMKSDSETRKILEIIEFLGRDGVSLSCPSLDADHPISLYRKMCTQALVHTQTQQIRNLASALGIHEEKPKTAFWDWIRTRYPVLTNLQYGTESAVRDLYIKQADAWHGDTELVKWREVLLDYLDRVR